MILIEREEIRYKLRKYGFASPDMTITELVEDELQPIEEDKARNGYWKHDESNDRAYDYCSACGCGTMRRTYGYNPDGREYMTEQSYSYCPRCGARMDKEATP